VLEGTFINKTNKSMKTSKKSIITMLALGISFVGFSQATLGVRSATSAATKASLSTNAAQRAVTATTTATRATVQTPVAQSASIKAGSNYNQVAVDHANAAAIEKANDHSALIPKETSVSTGTTVTVNSTVNANQSSSNNQDNLGTKVSVIAKDRSTTGTDKASAIKTEVDANVKADLTAGSDKSADAKTKASTKAAAQAKAKSNTKSNVH
jgi:hypothetical protein